MEEFNLKTENFIRIVEKDGNNNPIEWTLLEITMFTSTFSRANWIISIDWFCLIYLGLESHFKQYTACLFAHGSIQISLAIRSSQEWIFFCLCAAIWKLYISMVWFAISNQHHLKQKQLAADAKPNIENR